MTPDVNILVAASRSDHPHHSKALSWLNSALDDAEAGQSLLILPMMASGFLRLVTHPKVFNQPTPYLAAQRFIDAVISAPGVIMPKLGQEWSILTTLCEQHGLVGNDIPDAWIAAVLTSQDHLVSFDKGFLHFMEPSQFTRLLP
jgi:hypothetical protein